MSFMRFKGPIFCRSSQISSGARCAMAQWYIDQPNTGAATNHFRQRRGAEGVSFFVMVPSLQATLSPLKYSPAMIHG